jgi:transposase
MKCATLTRKIKVCRTDHRVRNITRLKPPIPFDHLQCIHIMSELRRFGTELSVNRSHYGQFTLEARMYMKGVADGGASHSQIAEAVGTSRQTVTTIINRINERRTGKTGNCRGGKYKTTAREERHLVILARKLPEATYWDLIRQADLNITPRTCKKIIQRHYIGNWRKAKRILLTEEDAQVRLEFTEEWSHPEKLAQLKLALFSDECAVQNSPGKPGQWVFRLASEKFRPDLVDTESHGRPRISLMMWGMVWQRDNEGGASKLVLCEGDSDAPHGGVSSRSYCDVLEEFIRPCYEAGDLFVQDYAHIHVNGRTPEWLEEHGIWAVDWPPHSPNLNPIEHVWHALKKKIKEKEPDFHELRDNIPHRAWAEEIIQRAWSELDSNHIYRLIESMERRPAAVKKHGAGTLFID